MNCVLRRTLCFERNRTVSGSCDVDASGPGAPSLVVSRALPSSSWQHRSRLRRSDTSCTGGYLLLPPRLQPLSLLVAVGAPLQLVSAAARDPETGNPGMEETARQEMVSAPLPPPEEGRVDNLLFHVILFHCWLPKTSLK